MRLVIADDEPPALERLQLMLAGVPDVEIVGLARDGETAVELARAMKPDLLLLDIQMPRRTGLGVAAELRESGGPEVVFVTAFEAFAPDAFEVEAADYLLKPVRLDRLRQALNRARRRAEERRALASMREIAPPDASRAGFWAPTERGRVRVALDEIDWIEAAKDYILLHTPRRCHILRMTMAALEAELSGQALTRVHRSAFVRLDRVVEVRRPTRWQMVLVMRDGVTTAVGSSYVARVRDELNKLAHASTPAS
jgi:two-component system LytT family response regulator